MIIQKKMGSKKDDTLISYKNSEIIVETTVIPTKQSYFTIFDRKSKAITTKESLEINGKKYKPIDINSSFIQSESILFPSKVSNYWSKEELVLSIQSYIYKICGYSQRL